MTQGFPALPLSVVKVVDRGVRDLDPDRIILYGSRARGDGSPTSDVDLCFVGVRGFFAEYADWVREESPGVYGFDLVQWERIPDPLRRNIEEDGVTIYAK